MRLLAVCAVAFAFGFLGSMPLAGPIAVMVVSRAARRAFGEALHLGLGAAAAEAVYAGVALWGFATLLARHPDVVPLSHGVTAVVLGILGARFAVWKPRPRKDRHERRAGTLVVGFTVSAINPTLFVTWSAAVAFLFSKGLAKGLDASSWPAAVLFGLSAGAGVGAWFAVLVAGLRRLEGKLPERVLTWTIRGLGVVLVGLGVWSGVQLIAWLGGEHARTAGEHRLLASDAYGGFRAARSGDRRRRRPRDRAGRHDQTRHRPDDAALRPRNRLQRSTPRRAHRAAVRSREDLQSAWIVR
jgi:threonine/homoserine/homoserine lactone efflux protein